MVVGSLRDLALYNNNMTTVEIILAILTLLFGGGNIIQLVQMRQLKARQTAETETVAIKNLQLVISSMQAEITRLNTRVIELETKNSELAGILSKLKI